MVIMMKRIRTIAVALVFCAGVLSLLAGRTAFAGNGPNADPKKSCAYLSVGRLWTEAEETGGYQYLYATGDTKTTTVSGMSYDVKSNTLTLSGYNNKLNYIFANEMGEDFKIKLVGSNEVQGIMVYGFGYGGSLSIEGNGSLTVNANKIAKNAFALYGEESVSKLFFGKNAMVKAYQQGSNATAFVNSSTVSENGIVFEGDNSGMTDKVTKESYTSGATSEAYRLDEDSLYSYYPTVAKDTSDKKQYGALVTLDEQDNRKYVIYELVNDEQLGTLAFPAQDESGNAVDPAQFNVTESWEDYISAYNVTPVFSTSLEQCKRVDGSDDDLYGCYFWSESVNGSEPVAYYSVYRFVDRQQDYGKLFAVAVAGEQKVLQSDTTILDKYEHISGSKFYGYNYFGDIMWNVSQNNPVQNKPTQNQPTQKSPVAKVVKIGTLIKDSSSKCTFRVTGKNTVALQKAANVKKLNVPTKITYLKKKYTVTSIAPKAFAKNKKMTAVILPSTISSIGKKAFSGCKKLKTITLKTTKLTTKAVGKQAFQGIAAKATIKVPKKKLNAYKKWLKNKGIGKKVKIKKL